MANTYLQRTYADGGNHKTGTFSFWVKRTRQGVDTEILYRMTNGSHYFQFIFEDTDSFIVREYLSSNNIYIKTNRQFKDTSNWYNIVVRFDTTQSTEADRVRIYVNGVQETSFDSAVYPSQDANLYLGEQQTFYIGSTSSANYFEGLMSHFHYCDGYSYGADSFGSTDSDTGEWSINTSPNVSYGTNGFFILKDGNSITDSSTNSNDHTLGGGTLTNTEDNPSNVFATINSLSLNHSDLAHLQYGSTEVKSSTSGSVKWYGASTLAFTKGKFYCEIKNMTTSNTSLSVGISMNPSRNQRENHAVGARNSDIGTENYSGNIVINNSNVSVGYGSTWTADGDICMLAVDADNDKFYVGKNGVWANSDNPSTGTGGYDMSGVSGHSESTPFYHFAFGSTSGSYMNEFNVNFGNGYFGTTQISSEGTNASGLGKFEYDVPTNFTALCTKGLNL